VNVNLILLNCPETFSVSHANYMKQIFLTDQTYAKHYKCPRETPQCYLKASKLSLIRFLKLPSVKLPLRVKLDSYRMKASDP
jgi:hypothetical protein